MIDDGLKMLAHVKVFGDIATRVLLLVHRGRHLSLLGITLSAFCALLRVTLTPLVTGAGVQEGDCRETSKCTRRRERRLRNGSGGVFFPARYATHSLEIDNVEGGR